ncbi:unnamed protein product [Ambrosiozyma monospora]|uniref:Unnamed protein product n=1 Tax=Ambrosiozyma monospora TaxID=43982 RepID=A0ACB5TYD4_AMBMO|nr:unnamed protein product [Ambrosiozyma monospora]
MVLKKKALTVSCSGLPDFMMLSTRLVETFLNYVIKELISDLDVTKQNGDEKVHVNDGYSWTFVAPNIYVDTKSVYVRFQDVLTLYLFKLLLNELGQEVESEDANDDEHKNEVLKVVSVPLLNGLEDKIKEEFKIDTDFVSKLKTDVIEKLKKLRSIYENNKDALDLDNPKAKIEGITSLYQNYKVDPKELVDVPADMVESVKLRIIEFRLHSIKNEEAKKAEQALSDKRKSKMKLKRLFNNLHKGSKKNKTDLSYDSDEEDELEEKDDGIDDEEFEKMSEARMKENSERTAYQRLQQAEQREGIRLKNVNAFRTRVDHKVYVETYLPKSREKFLEKFVNDINEENTIDANFKFA